jgi:beta-glucanase (GH16 family)
MRRCLGCCAVLAAVAVVALPRQEAAEPAAAWKLTWSDEFDGQTIDPAKWDFDVGNGFYNYGAKAWISGWGNDERQYYTKDAANAFVKDGTLHVRALKESLHGCGYTSARLKTKKRDGTVLFSQKYGKFEWRAKCPTGQGVWPALWMLPADETYGTWAASGEIDVLEVRGQKPGEVVNTIHYGGRWPVNTESSVTYKFPAGGTVADWHVYAVEWTPGVIRWTVDGKESARQAFWWSTSKLDGEQGVRPRGEADLNPWPAPFDRPFTLVINLAVGGKFLGDPDATTPFPAEMVVDYVRVSEKFGGYAPTKPRGPGKLPFAGR